jgi:uncharacterized protein YaiI (UPF0178 family)
VRIWIDADACPRDVKDVVYRAAQRTERSVVVVANQAMHVPRSPLIRLERVGGGLDVADDHIVAHAEAGDLAITADIPLAARLVEKRVMVIDPRGDIYDEENVRERLSVRDFMAGVREAGVITGGSPAWGPRDKQRFADALDRTLRANR